MSKNTINKRVNIYINGKEVEGTIRNMQNEYRRLNREVKDLPVGSEEYNKKVREMAGLRKHIDDHRKSLRSTNTLWENITKSVGRFALLAAGAFSARAIANYGKELFNLAREMDAMDRKAQIVFGRTLPMVTEEARKNAEQMGLTANQYVDLASNMQDVLIPMGFQREEAADLSVQMINLSGALSEWTGGQMSAADTSRILQGALTGQRQSLRQLGITIQQSEIDARLAEQGLNDLTGATLQQAQAAATLEIIMEKSADAQTAFAENTDSLVRNQAQARARLEEVRETLAMRLMPQWEAFARVQNNIAGIAVRLARGWEQQRTEGQRQVESLKAQQQQANILFTTLNNLNSRLEEVAEGTDEYNEIAEAKRNTLDELNREYGDYLPNLLDEKSSIDDILAAQEALNNEMLKKQLIIAFQEEITEALNKEVEARRRLAQIERDRASEAARRAGDDLSAIGGEQFAQRAEKNLNNILDASETLNRSLVEESQKAQEEINNVYDDLFQSVGTSIQSVMAQLNESMGIQVNRTQDTARAVRDISERDQMRAEADLERHLQRVNDLYERFQEEQFLNQLNEENRQIVESQNRFKKQIDQIAEAQAQVRQRILDLMEGDTDDPANQERIRELQTQLQELGDMRVSMERQSLIEIAALRQEFQEKDLQNQLEVDRILMDEQERRRMEIIEYYDELIEKKGITDEQIIALEKRKNEALEELEREHQEKKIDIEREIREALGDIDPLEAELEATRLHFERLLKLAEEYGLDTIALENKLNSELERIRQEHFGRQMDTQIAQIQALGGAFNSLGNSVASMMDEMGEETAGFVAFQKLATLASIAFDTGAAIAAMTRNQAGSSPDPITLAARIASGIAIILGNIAQATQLVNSTQVPQRKEGGFYSVTGQDDGRTYNARYIGNQDTGMLPGQPSLVLASEQGPEYFVANHHLRHPAVFDHVRAIENITRGRTLPQFAEGGMNTNSTDGSDGRTSIETSDNENTENNQNSELLVATLQTLTQILASGIEAKIADDTTINLLRRYNQLNEMSGNTLSQDRIFTPNGRQKR